MSTDVEHWGLGFQNVLCKSNITRLNLLIEGYGINDSTYYVREKDIGIARTELEDGIDKMEKMVAE